MCSILRVSWLRRWAQPSHLGKQLILDSIEYDDNGTSEPSYSGNANGRHDRQDCYSWLFGNENWWIYISDAKSVRCEFVL